jgi:hypothetical protein
MKNDDSMKKEYDFSKGVRGRFFHKAEATHTPVYLEPDVEEQLTRLADKEHSGLGIVVNRWLRRDMEMAVHEEPASYVTKKPDN